MPASAPSNCSQKVKVKYLTSVSSSLYKPNSNVCLIFGYLIHSFDALFCLTEQTKLCVDLEFITSTHPFPLPLDGTAECYHSDSLQGFGSDRPHGVTLVMVAQWWRRLLSWVDVWYWHSREHTVWCQRPTECLPTFRPSNGGWEALFSLLCSEGHHLETRGSW